MSNVSALIGVIYGFVVFFLMIVDFIPQNSQVLSL